MILRYIAPVAIIGLLSGCASTARVNQFKAFAELGAKSQTAVSKIVDEATSSILLGFDGNLKIKVNN